MISRRTIIGLLTTCLLLAGCAVQRSKAPQIDAKVAYALNLESQVAQANKDYTTFFTDVGRAEKQGQLPHADVVALNAIGHQLKPIIEEANRLTKTYAQNYDSTVANQIGQLLLRIAADFSALYTQRAAAVVKGAPK